jgi:hypothetical protein
MKYKVFVSSTINDLMQERVAAEKAILSAQCEPRMSDKTFTAVDANSFDACMTELEESDIYILILGERYGWEYEGKSVTEWEYLKAIELKKPRIVFNLAYIRNREVKQNEFINRVGDFDAGRFWKTAKDVFELTETVISNLIPIRFSPRVQTARINYKREEVIKQSKGTAWKLTYRSGEAIVAARAMELAAGDTFGDKHFDFLVKGDILYTFSDLSQASSPYRKIIDLGTIEEIAVTDLTATLDGENALKYLLRNVVRHKLASQNVAYMAEENLFYFGGKPVMSDVSIGWGDNKNAQRNVITQIWSKEKLVDGVKQPAHIVCFRHFAMRITFPVLGGKWYACINPTYICTSANGNGRRKSRFSEHYVKGKKKLENNDAVYQNVRCWAWYLSPHYGSFTPYPHLQFEPAVTFDEMPYLNDQKWVPAKKAEEKKANAEGELSSIKPGETFSLGF